MVDRQAQRLFGAHISRRTDHGADLSTRELAFGPGRVRLADPRDAEVEQLGGPPVRRQQDVGRLHVAMDDTRSVRIAERGGELSPQRQHPLARHPPRRRQRDVEGLAVDQLHRDIGDAVRLAHVVDRGDVGMAQRAGRARLSQETLAQVGMARVVGLQDLDRDRAADVRIAGAVYVGHRALAEAALDTVATKSSDRRRFGGHALAW